MQGLWGSHLCEDHTERNKSLPQHTLHDGALPLSAELHALDVYSAGTVELASSTCTQKAMQNCHALYMYSQGTAELPRTRYVPRRHSVNLHSAELPRPRCVLRRHCRTATHYMRTQNTLQNCHALDVQSAELQRP